MVFPFYFIRVLFLNEQVAVVLEQLCISEVRMQGFVKAIWFELNIQCKSGRL